MTNDNKVIENTNVLIKDKRIISISDSLPTNAIIIDGTLKWLIPGLIDMHVHLAAHANFGESSPTQGANFFFDSQDMPLTGARSEEIHVTKSRRGHIRESVISV